jgi:hypothetical protein
MNNEGNKPPLIRIGRVESVDLYEIKDTELELFEKGSPADLQLNFAIFLVSTAFSAIVALCTATFANSTVHTTFIVVAVVGILLASYLFISWWRSRTSVKAACLIIRRRIKETISTDVINRENLEAVASVDRSEPPSGD